MSNSIKGKNFEDNKGNTFTVVDIDGAVAHLNDGSRIAVERLIDPAFFTRKDVFVNESKSTNNNMADGNLLNLFDDSKRFQNLAAQITTGLNTGKIDMSRVDDGSSTEGTPTVQVRVISDEPIVESRNVVEDPNIDQIEIQKLIAKANAMNTNSIAQQVQSQNQMLAKYVDEEDVDQNIIKKLETTLIKQTQDVVEQHHNPQVVNQPTEQKMVFEDPAVSIFKGIKRGQKFSILVKIDDMIPTKEFMKMMEENYDTSIIEFLASDMYKKIMSDPIVIKKQISDKLREIVFPKKRAKTKPSKAAAKKTAKVTKPTTKKTTK